MLSLLRRLTLVVGLLLSVGCAHYDRVSVSVRSQDTKIPIARAEVEVSYPVPEYFLTSPRPKRDMGQTDDSGTAVVKIAKNMSFIITLHPVDGPVQSISFSRAEGQVLPSEWVPTHAKEGGSGTSEVRLSIER